jgi:hypothetical protein
MDYMTEEFLTAGLSVVYDANVMRAKDRANLRDLAFRCHAQPLVIWFQLDADTSYARNLKRDRRRADDKYAARWDRSGFEAVLGQMQNPSVSEQYLVLSGKHIFATQRSTVVNKLRDLNVLTIDEASSHVVKPGMVNLVPGRVDMTRRNLTIR